MAHGGTVISSATLIMWDKDGRKERKGRMNESERKDFNYSGIELSRIVYLSTRSVSISALRPRSIRLSLSGFSSS